MRFDVTVLGCGSASPKRSHRPSAQVVQYEGSTFLLDCGEGTQLRLKEYGISIQRISHIFITHVHGDHCLGLPGLISTMHLLGRRSDLHIWAHTPLQAAVMQFLAISESVLRFQVLWHPLDPESEQLLLQSKRLQIRSFPLKHRIACCGFILKEKPRPRKILPAALQAYQPSIAQIKAIKEGEDLRMADGTTVPNAQLTSAPASPRSYAYCTDTAFSRNTARYVAGVNLLYHEATFLEQERERADKTFHSTAADAARIAYLAKAQHLLLGHFSARYHSLDAFIAEAQVHFTAVTLAEEGSTYAV